ncbi:MAG: 6-carboxytetrahydropterin synthase QueD [Candidatus Bathyarchaeia archaeon]|jgi:6-pyruvoyltetrahydropterin/6-carboxytetrahydropterin synthase
MERDPLAEDEATFRLRVETTFAAAHKVVDSNGKCENLHGHTWTVELFVLGEKTEPNGMVIDFAILKAALKKVTDKLDHTYLNELKELENPTSENIAKYCFNQLASILPQKPKLEKVRVWESPKSWCEYLG